MSTVMSKDPGDDPDEQSQEQEAESADEQTHRPQAALRLRQDGQSDSGEPQQERKLQDH